VSDYLGQMQGVAESTLGQWILKGLVIPEGVSLSNDAISRKSFDELSAALAREKVKNEINRLQGELREASANPDLTAQLLQRVHLLRLSLENSK
jgi:hypothetical protein